MTKQVGIRSLGHLRWLLTAATSSPPPASWRRNTLVRRLSYWMGFGLDPVAVQRVPSWGSVWGASRKRRLVGPKVATAEDQTRGAAIMVAPRVSVLRKW